MGSERNVVYCLCGESLVYNKLSYDDSDFYGGSTNRVLDTIEDVDRRKQDEIRSSAFEDGGFVSKEYLEELKSRYGKHSTLISKIDSEAQESDSQRQTKQIDQYLQSILNEDIKPFHSDGEAENGFLDRTRPTLNSKKVKPHPGDVDVPDPEFQPTGQTQPSEPAKKVSL